MSVRWTPLVVLATGERDVAVCRDEDHGMLVLTTREAGAEDWGAGSGIEGFEPVWMGVPGAWAIGGRAPAGVAAVEVRDVRGELQPAALGDGAWVAVSPMWTRAAEQEAALFRDAAGAVVPRPGPAGAPVADASISCPACGTCRWELVDLDQAMHREVRCTTCGHAARMGVFFGARGAASEGRPARDYAQHARDTLADARFPLIWLAGDAAPPRVAGFGSSNATLNRVTFAHTAEPAPGAPWVSVETALEPWPEDPALLARDALAALVGILTQEDWPHASEAAVSLWLDARRREQVRSAAGAPERGCEIPVDGAACPFTVAGEDTRWAASGRLELDGHPLEITVQAAGIAPAAIALARLRDPLDTLAP